MVTHLEQEIASQPDIIAQVMDKELTRVVQIVAKLRTFSYAMIAARGTSDHAATYATYIWPVLTGYPVALATPSLYTLYSAPPRLDDALVIGISQSGQSPDVYSVVEEGRRQGRPTLAITNDANSPLAQAADEVIELHAGIEQSVAATKTYTAQLTIMALLAAAWSGQQQHLDDLQRLPDMLAATLANTDTIASRAERYSFMDQCVVIGRGYNYATAFEIALKIKELTYVLTHAYSSADFRHGPIATISEGSAAMLIMPTGIAFDDMLNLAHELKQRGAELLIVSDDEQTKDLATTWLPMAATVPEWISPIVSVVPGQIFALHLAQAKGFNPDQPRGLHKVTRTL
ncbi:MAG: SIS domain-containing protein [Chloroflexi bacterium AL-W]|nr:SIS domain-containing protein [Chloroflexi bacterium AL-N1]NOK66054.1 SIS domain-containing protein [Chloroflexi bacterium AL-N10]NOK72935.1 SIS domain-containing protein [Chloroflexi bacterium AL-N5]NOK79832.1 SIS domain-containing protein [Chloroflexi bacterium AL-W]NOK88312.1 SIS domain-containing protein [Chloroflexi bacterium AL-N15]